MVSQPSLLVQNEYIIHIVQFWQYTTMRIKQSPSSGAGVGSCSIAQMESVRVFLGSFPAGAVFPIFTDTSTMFVGLKNYFLVNFEKDDDL